MLSLALSGRHCAGAGAVWRCYDKVVHLRLESVPKRIAYVALRRDAQAW